MCPLPSGRACPAPSTSTGCSRSPSAASWPPTSAGTVSCSTWAAGSPRGCCRTVSCRPSANSCRCGWTSWAAPPGSVTDVVLSHLHIDHVGWASTSGVPTFPRAGHHIHTADWKHYVDGDADDAVRRKVGPLRDTALLWDGDSVAPFDWLRLVHAPGHTPGTSVALIESRGQSLALVGDLFHHPAALDHPHWRCGFDWDTQQAAAARTEWLERLRTTRTPLVGPHFPGLEPVMLR
ncbi:MBL fold metallo-hydrolase [Streptomyces sp. NPDC092295]|uniref:MBL fold metallo-hydrolase n=1 Tax=Streptomyces sp. NPDC092295 TaxID=3366011 RepID=UPI003808871C